MPSRGPFQSQPSVILWILGQGFSQCESADCYQLQTTPHWLIGIIHLQSRAWMHDWLETAQCGASGTDCVCVCVLGLFQVQGHWRVLSKILPESFCLGSQSARTAVRSSLADVLALRKQRPCSRVSKRMVWSSLRAGLASSVPLWQIRVLFWKINPLIYSSGDKSYKNS